MDNHPITPSTSDPTLSLSKQAIDAPRQPHKLPPPPSKIQRPVAAADISTDISTDISSEAGGAIVAKLKGQYHQPNGGLVLHMLQELQYLLNSWQQEILELEQKIAVVRESGPIVAGWLEAEANNTEFSLESLEPIPEILQQQSLDYQLCSLDERGEVAARDCPEPEMFGISKALARHQQLRQLIDRKSNLEANIKHTLATLVHLRMEIY
jgi:hypothetical protein